MIDPIIRSILAAFGYKLMYEDHRGLYDYRYDVIDIITTRPIHVDMSVAYPDAKIKVMKI